MTTSYACSAFTWGAAVEQIMGKTQKDLHSLIYANKKPQGQGIDASMEGFWWSLYINM
jgi:hypothetical protein